MTYSRIPIARPHLTELETEYVNEALRNQWITQGPFVEKAEEKLKALTGRKYAICTSSGTTALQVAILALNDQFRWRTSEGEKRSPYIACPTLTFAAVFNAIELAHCTPVYLGVDKETWQSPISEWWRVLRKVDCFIAAPCYGGLGPMDGIEELCGNAKMPLIEDCSESFTGSWRNRKAGSFGDISICSFYANKILTSSEGGCIFTDSEELAKACRLIINHGTTKASYQRTRLGFNGRMNDMSAAVLCAQIERLPEMLERRRQILTQYRGAAGVEWDVPLRENSEEIPATWMWAGVPSAKVNGVHAKAQELNVETRPVFPCGHNKGWTGLTSDHQPLKVAEEISDSGICLPLSSAMTDEEVERVCTLIKSV